MHTLNRFDTNIGPVDQKEGAIRDILSPWMSFILHWHRRGPTAALQGLDLVQMKAVLDGAQVPRIVKLHLCARLSLRLALQLQAEVAKNCMTSTNLSGLRVCSQTHLCSMHRELGRVSLFCLCKLSDISHPVKVWIAPPLSSLASKWGKNYSSVLSNR